MMKYLIWGATVLTTTLLVLILNGNIWGSGTLPPFGKLLNPFNGIWQNLEIDWSDISVASQSIYGDIEIIIDDREVPHILANHLSDAMYAQGFMLATHRYFQMDMMARAASGRVAEVAGPQRLDFDIRQRKKGLAYAADNALRGWQKFPEEYELIEAYVEGVNTVVEQWSEADYPLEYKLLNIKPEPWSALKCALVSKMMANDLAGRDNDIGATNTLALLGLDTFTDIYDEHEAVETPVITDPYISDAPSMRADTVWHLFDIRKIYKTDFIPPTRGIGSNNWAISGSKTASGQPIFANDPHLSLSLPSIWYEMHIQYEDVNTYGVTIPGMPGLMMGWNEHIAWGETNVGQDIRDYHTITWANEERSHYIVDGESVPTEWKIECYQIKGQDDYIDTVAYTIFGPVIYESHDGKSDLAVRWLSHDEPGLPEMATFIRGFQAKSYDQYLNATEVFLTPAQNFLAADKDDNIGLRVNGLFPKKYSQDGRFIKKGNTRDALWKEYIPRDENPQVKNPEQGWIASSNQVSASKAYPYYFTGTFEHYRNRTIDSLLNTMNEITLADMKAMQQNSYSSKAQQLLPHLLTVVEDIQMNQTERQCLQELKEWNYHYEPDMLSPSYFEEWYRLIYRSTWDEIYQYKDTMQVLYPSTWKTIELLIEQPNYPYFDNHETEEIETAKEIIANAYRNMVDKMQSRSKENLSNQWNDYSPMSIYHLLRIPVFSRLNVLHTGCGDAINASRNNFGPSWRMVVELGDHPIGHVINPGGQSGNPLHPLYDDGITQWEIGEYNLIDIHIDRSTLAADGKRIQIIAQ